jgi:hypothetical protein
MKAATDGAIPAVATLPPLQLVPGQYHPPVWANEAEMIAVENHNLTVALAEMEADPLSSDDLELDLDFALDADFED